MMKMFSTHLEAIQNVILEREYDSDVEKHCACGNGLAIFRCQECFDLEPSCRKCLLAAHHQHPFHRVQEWTGGHYVRRDLGDLGHVLNLGHRGHRCPNAMATSEGRRTTIAHTNGIHSRRILYCRCDSTIEPLQLVRSGLFPATIDQPETAFTFTVLRDFHAHSLASKKTAYDHFYALRKLTNNACPQTVVVRISSHNIVIDAHCFPGLLSPILACGTPLVLSCDGSSCGTGAQHRQTYALSETWVTTCLLSCVSGVGNECR